MQIATKFIADLAVSTAKIAANAVTNAKLAQMAATTIKGNVTGGAADPADLTGTQVTTMLDTFTDLLKGLAPASGGGTANFLRADGTWAVPPGTGAVTGGYESITLDGTDITNQYVDLAEEVTPNTLQVAVSGVVQRQGVDYTLTTEAGPITRVTFAGDLATGGAAELVATDVMEFQYLY